MKLGSRAGASLALATLLGLVLPAVGATEELGVNEIMQRVYDRDDGDDAISDIQMTLFDKNGDQRQRVVRSFAKDFGADTKMIIFFLEPADVKDIGLLVDDNAGPESDDDQWLYLPALKKTKRIAASDQTGSFVGTDFSFADLTERENANYEYELLGVEPVRGEPTWKIRATPNEREIQRTGYTRSVIWVRQDSFVVVRAVHWLREGGRMKYFDVSRLEQVDGIWSALETTMTTKRKDQSIEHRTLLRVSNIQYDQGYDPGMFSVRTIEKGP